MATNGKKSKKKIIIFSVIGLLAVTAGVVLFLGSKKEPIVSVQTEKVKRHTITQVVTATGKIQPEIQVKISPEVSGEIVDLPVKEGQKVRKGDVLMKIKPDVYVAQRDQYAAGLLSAKATLSRAEPEYNRIKELFSKGLVSQAEYDQAKAAHESAKASYAQATASLNQANENLRKTTILSPMDGTVSQLNSRLGERVLGTQQFQGTDVMTIADLSRMEGRVDVSETDVVRLHLGDTARIAVDAFPDKKVNAIVYEIANTAKSKGLGTQEEVTNFEVKMRVISQGITLRPGMSMTADIETETKQDVLAVPIQSVTTRMPKMEGKEPPKDGQSGEFVAASNGGNGKKAENKPKEVIFVVEENVVKAMPVKRGISNDAYVEISEGAKEDMQVVSGSYKAINRELEDGSKVKIEEPKKSGPRTDDKQS
ncbi:MAG: efflux RND transporter periplasmic adaptor subunit [Bacteroidetes bacterium]|nr:efflux RND transporter periplasmic adaptor subunit [Bacteroidota bacterium]MCW5895004.1 efflux RND transporter periplasmic adaptor subunit [Bacteroidota bacterium]